MKAIVYTQYGSPDVLHLQEMTQPAPADHEILIRVAATSVNIGDLMARNFGNITPRQFSMPIFFWLPSRLVFGLRRPKNHILGSEFAGEVAAVGKAVTRFQPGDRVFGYRGMNLGANVEYLCMPEDGMVVPTPAGMTDEEAATVPYGALTALSLLRKMNIQPGQKVLINGASGAIGSYAVQIARYFGAEVTGVCSTAGVDFVKSLGAAEVIDYTQVDFTRSGKTYDLIMDILNKSSFGRCKKSLKSNGRYLLVSFKVKQLWQMFWTSRFGGKKVVCALSNETPADLAVIKEMLEAGQLKATVDKSFRMEQAAEAHRYIENGHKRGGVILTYGSSLA
ncbi:MAG: NAD(P)-dependent alcohol dehydrogenase [Anaerolineae bacterium]|nr:NAD(P)-dependent alcohol dehydrogenase [Anaerolineae bacterium]